MIMYSRFNTGGGGGEEVKNCILPLIKGGKVVKKIGLKIECIVLVEF